MYDCATSCYYKLSRACLDCLINYYYKKEKYLPIGSSSCMWTTVMSFNTELAYEIAMLCLVCKFLEICEPIGGLSQNLV